MTRKELKKLSWEQITPQIFPLFLITLIIGALTYVTYLFLFYTLLPDWLLILISAPFALSSNIIYLNLVNGISPTTNDAFSGFKKYFRALGVYFLQTLFTLLWLCVFILPGIVKHYSYAMAPYIMLDNPDISPLEAIRMSKKMMNGHEWDLFVLDLSFIAWDLFALVTCGTGAIWVSPYRKTACANFYKNLKDKK